MNACTYIQQVPSSVELAPPPWVGALGPDRRSFADRYRHRYRLVVSWPARDAHVPHTHTCGVIASAKRARKVPVVSQTAHRRDGATPRRARGAQRASGRKSRRETNLISVIGGSCAGANTRTLAARPARVVATPWARGEAFGGRTVLFWAPAWVLGRRAARLKFRRSGSPKKSEVVTAL